jgi:hypothetical protein
MPNNFGRAVDSGRGKHPDLDDDGELRGDVYQEAPRRDFNRMASDPGRWQSFMDRVATEQSELDPWVQQQIAGRAFGSAADPYDGYQQYRQELRLLQDTLGDQRSISGRDVERMSQAEYERHFDEHGRPRSGVVYRPTSGRDVDVRETGLDRFSQRELEQGRQP